VTRRLLLLAALALPIVAPTTPPVRAAPTCIGGTDVGSLDRLFDAEPGGMVAADYQRAIELPDGRTLWLFQDATVELPPPPPPGPNDPPPPPGTPPPETHRLLHNVGLLQTGTCFDLLRSGTAADPASWLFAGQTTQFGRWFWPLDAEMGSDGRLYVFMAEMLEQGPLYLSYTTPISTRAVAIDVGRMRPVWYGTPGDSTGALYGFSIASDQRWTYLYAHCHRQFGHSTVGLFPGAHDFDCADDVFVGRVRKGQVLDQPAYWDGSTWQNDRNRAVPVMPREGRAINPSQIRWTGTEFVAVTKVGDWFGDTIVFDRAPAAQGPWTTYTRMPATPKCSPNACNTYFASWIPGGGDKGYDMIGLSHNVWSGELSVVNRPTFHQLAPPGSHSRATRCALVDC
jgi:hypothetical protein